VKLSPSYNPLQIFSDLTSIISVLLPPVSYKADKNIIKVASNAVSSANSVASSARSSAANVASSASSSGASAATNTGAAPHDIAVSGTGVIAGALVALMGML